MPMNIARNHITPPTGDASSLDAGRTGEGLAAGASQQDLRGIDWQALRSRLFATALPHPPGTDITSTRLRLRGSFDGCAASALHAYEASLMPVNRDASSNGKSDEGNDASVADASAKGERG